MSPFFLQPLFQEDTKPLCIMSQSHKYLLSPLGDQGIGQYFHITFVSLDIAFTDSK